MSDHDKDQLCARIEELEKGKLELNEQLDIVQQGEPVLLPCPFCGAEPERVTLEEGENFGGDVIVCRGCLACSRVVFGEKEGLIEAWNKRPVPAVQREPVAWYLPGEGGCDSQFRDHATVKSCTGNPWAGWQPLYAHPQPAPDMTGLVKALECALETMENVDGANDCSRGIDAVEEALAAHRKGGEV